MSMLAYLCEKACISEPADRSDSINDLLMPLHSVLFVYDTYIQQTLKVVEAMAEVLRDRSCEVTLAAIEFTGPRYAGRAGVPGGLNPELFAVDLLLMESSS